MIKAPGGRKLPVPTPPSPMAIPTKREMAPQCLCPTGVGWDLAPLNASLKPGAKPIPPFPCKLGCLQLSHEVGAGLALDGRYSGGWEKRQGLTSCAKLHYNELLPCCCTHSRVGCICTGRGIPTPCSAPEVASSQ